MKNKKELFGIYLPLFIVVAMAAVAIRTVACFLHFDPKTYYYTTRVLISVSDYTVVAASVFFITYIFTARNDLKLIPNFTSPATYIPTGLTSAALLFFAKGMFDEASLIKKNSEILGNTRSYTVLIILAFAVSVLSVLSIIHFILTALDERSHSGNRAKFGLFTVVLLSAYATYLYFNTKLPINSPTKITDQMAYLFASIFFLYETRLSLGREKWREYISFGFIAAMLCAYSSIPSIIIYIADKTVLSNNIYESILTFTLFIFTTARICLTGELIEDTPSPLAKSLINAADERHYELNPETEEPTETAEENDDNQITIEDIAENGEEDFLKESAEELQEDAVAERQEE